MVDEAAHLNWRSSGCATGACVEVAWAAGTVYVRDSLHPDGARLALSSTGWRRFLEAVKRGEYDQAAG